MSDNNPTGPASPCTKACKLDPASGLCRGCLRSMEEILRWGGASRDERRRILDTVALRRSREPRASSGGSSLT